MTSSLSTPAIQPLSHEYKITKMKTPLLWIIGMSQFNLLTIYTYFVFLSQSKIILLKKFTIMLFCVQ